MCVCVCERKENSRIIKFLAPNETRWMPAWRLKFEEEEEKKMKNESSLNFPEIDFFPSSLSLSLSLARSLARSAPPTLPSPGSALCPSPPVLHPLPPVPSQIRGVKQGGRKRVKMDQKKNINGGRGETCPCRCFIFEAFIHRRGKVMIID